jgi:hypothetical protein
MDRTKRKKPRVRGSAGDKPQSSQLAKPAQLLPMPSYKLDKIDGDVTETWAAMMLDTIVEEGASKDQRKQSS